MSSKKLDLKGLFRKEHEGKWVALSPDRKKILGHSNDLTKLVAEVKNSEAVYEKILRSDRLYAF